MDILVSSVWMQVLTHGGGVLGGSNTPLWIRKRIRPPPPPLLIREGGHVWLTLSRAWETDSSFFEEEKKSAGPPPPPAPATFSGLQPIVKHLS